MIFKTDNGFHLQGKGMSYIIEINESGDVLHTYFGKKLRKRNTAAIEQRWSVWNAYAADKWTLDICPQEYPTYGYTDLKTPAYSFVGGSGSGIARPVYKSCKISKGAAHTNGMPSLFEGAAHAQTLEIVCEDKAAGIELCLVYTVFDEYDIIARSTYIRNCGKGKIRLLSAYSAALDMDKADYELIYFAGGWSREREMVRTEIKEGMKLDISNARGGSGHCINPFVMLCSKNADEYSGEVYSMALVYSGNHSSKLECDQFGNVRLMQGINPFGFEWTLDEDEAFATPQTVMAYSDCGISGISHCMHDVIRNNLCRSEWVNRERPVLINNWEATYFDFDEAKLLDIAALAAKQGVELFVLDDGWFGNRYDEESSMGDWVVNRKKLPSGIDGFANKINELGLKFGLWFEPESVNPDSDIYRQHSDWIVRTAYAEPTQSRFEYLLDLTKKEVRDYIVETVCKVIEAANIEYIKWDMNRPMTDMPRLGFNHEFTLGFYDITDRITSRFPHILFEGCSGGGGRFDLGVLAYMPQIWTSDNSDAVKRMEIQYSTSIAYPISSISAHVSAVPNHQNGRITSLKTRADIALCGIFGYELDITKMSENELDELKGQIAEYKSLRSLILDCDFYRLENPYTGNYCAWMAAAKDRSEAFVVCAKRLAQSNYEEKRIRLRGLDEGCAYVDVYSGRVYGGDELMYRGFVPVFKNEDFSTYTLHLKKANKE